MARTRARRGPGVAAIALVVAVLTALAVAGPAAATVEPPPDQIPAGGDWSPSQIARMVNLISRTEKAMPREFPATYTDGGTELEALGFFNFGATAPGGYDHWINPERLVDGHTLSPNHVESVVYQRNAAGVWELKAAMFMLPPDVGMDEIPDRISWLPGWHGHPELCIGPDGTFAGITYPTNPSCPPGTRSGATPLMMHVWLEDPGCGHRFGGVGVTGLHCDVVHHHM